MIIDVENFYGLTNSTLSQRFAANSGAATFGTALNIGNFGRYQRGIQIMSDAAYSGFWTLSVTGSNPIYAGAAIFPIQLQSTNRYAPIRFLQTGTVHVSVFLNPSGVVTVLNGAGTQLATYTIANFTLSTWYYIEFGAYIDNVSGSVEVKLNDKTIISQSNVDTNNGSSGTVVVNQVGTFAGNQLSATNIIYMSDVYLTNTMGTNPDTNGFLGDIRIVSLIPSQSGDQINFMPSASTNVSQVADGISVNGDTTFVSASTVGSMDLYKTFPYTGSATKIYGVNVKTYARKTDAGLREIVAAIKSGSTINYSPTSSLSDTYLFQSSTFETNPNTSTAWSSLEQIHNTQIGLKL